MDGRAGVSSGGAHTEGVAAIELTAAPERGIREGRAEDAAMKEPPAAVGERQGRAYRGCVAGVGVPREQAAVAKEGREGERAGDVSAGEIHSSNGDDNRSETRGCSRGWTPCSSREAAG